MHKFLHKIIIIHKSLGTVGCFLPPDIHGARNKSEDR